MWGINKHYPIEVDFEVLARKFKSLFEILYNFLVPYILDFWKTGMINPLTYIQDKVQDVKTLIQNVNQCS